jgi:subtilisin family serine protease
VTNVAWLLRPVRLRAVLSTMAVLAITAAITTAAVPAAHASQAESAQAGAGSATATRADEWWLAALNVTAAWRAAPAKGKGVTIAVLSTGVYARHPDLAGTVTTGPDLSQTGREPGDQYWGAEGTAVASLMAGHGHGTDHAEGLTGVAPGARILSIQVTLEYDDPLNSDAAITRRLPAAIASGIRYAVSHGATVIALPLDPGTLGSAVSGDPAAAGGSQAERAAVRYALAHNVLLVGPAGDNGAGSRTVNYPAAYPGVIAVGATARDGKLSPFTNAGSYVALTAPGSGDTPLTPGANDTVTDPAAGLLVAAPGGGYQSLASSDMASALTAGVAALIRARYPRLTVAEVTTALEDGATVPRADRSGTRTSAAAEPGWGHGALDAATAVTAAGTIAAAHPAPSPKPTPSPTPSKPAPAAQPTFGASTARPAAIDRGNPGAALRTFLLYLLVAAGVLIAALIGALAIARIRRRDPDERSARAARAARTGPPRHAKTPLALQPPTGSFTRAIGPVQALRAIGPPPGAPAAHPASAVARSRRMPRVAGTPPWPAAHPPQEALPQGTVPQGIVPYDGQAPQSAVLPLAPWEKSPAEFAAAPFLEEEPPRPVSSTGPMYIWNPPDDPPKRIPPVLP